MGSQDLLSPPRPSVITVCYLDLCKPQRQTSTCMSELTNELFFFSSLSLFYLSSIHHLFFSLPPSLPPPQPSHRWLSPSLAHMEAGSSHCPGASASEALLWEIPPETQACTLNANVQPHLNWKSERLWPLEHFFHTRDTHTVCNADTYACNLDTQQSTRLLLLGPPSSRRAVLFLAWAGTYVTGEHV